MAKAISGNTSLHVACFVAVFLRVSEPCLRKSAWVATQTARQDGSWHPSFSRAGSGLPVGLPSPEGGACPTHGCPYMQQHFPCLEWLCQPVPLSCTVLLFSQYSLVLYTHASAVGFEVCTHSLDDDIDLSSSTLSPCYLKHYLHLVSLRRHDLNPLPLLLLRRAGWLLPAPLPFVHAHVHPELSHTPGSYILHMKVMGSKLPFFACLCLVWVPQASIRPLPVCSSMAVLQRTPPLRCLPVHPPIAPFSAFMGASPIAGLL